MARITKSVRSAQTADIIVGRRVRERRMEIGMTQEVLAAKCGITFQQLQKYENGSNRISIGRLFQIAKALNVDPAELIDGADAAHAQEKRDDKLTREDRHVLKAYAGIPNPNLKRHVLQMMRELAKHAVPVPYTSRKRRTAA